MIDFTKKGKEEFDEYQKRQQTRKAVKEITKTDRNSTTRDDDDGKSSSHGR